MSSIGLSALQSPYSHSPLDLLYRQHGDTRSMSLLSDPKHKFDFRSVTNSSLGLVISEEIFTGVKNLVKAIIDYIAKCLTTTVTVESHNPSVRWVKAWMDAQSFQDKPAAYNVDVEFDVVGMIRSGQKNSKPKVEIKPTSDLRFFFYKNRLMWFKKNTETSTENEGFRSRTTQKVSYSITTFGWSPVIIKELIGDAQELYNDDEGVSRIPVHIMDGRGNWSRSAFNRKRSIESVIMPKDAKHRLLDDVKEFLCSENWYLDRGIPFRRGYLLYGVPGAGKTSLIYALACELDLEIYVISLGGESMTDENLNEALSETSSNCIVLIEDIDAAFTERKKDSESKSKLTFSGLLNALDGLSAQEGRIVFMTTNHIERLDSALIRPGRVDVRVKFDYAIKSQLMDLFQTFYKDAVEEEKLEIMASEFASALPAGKLSMAQLQGFLLAFKTKPQEAIEQASTWAAQVLDGDAIVSANGVEDLDTAAEPQ